MKLLTVVATVSLVFSSMAQSQELLLYGGDGHDDFLGCLNCGAFAADSICNEYGAGNEFSQGIFNEYSSYGSEFSSKSPWNAYSSSESVPVVVDRNGNFYGYFTVNTFRSDAVSFAEGLKEIYEISKGDLEIVRALMCRQ